MLIKYLFNIVKGIYSRYLLTHLYSSAWFQPGAVFLYTPNTYIALNISYAQINDRIWKGREKCKRKTFFG